VGDEGEGRVVLGDDDYGVIEIKKPRIKLPKVDPNNLVLKNLTAAMKATQYGDIVTAQFDKNIKQNNATITQSIRFTPGDPAVINQVAQLKPANGEPNFNAVFMPVGGTQIETISSALSYNKLMPREIKRLGTGLWDDPRIAAQPNMQGAWFAAPSPSARRAFEQKFQSTGISSYGDNLIHKNSSPQHPILRAETSIENPT